MNAYKVNDQGETHIVAAGSILQAITVASDNDGSIIEGIEDVALIPKKDWEGLKISDPEEPEFDGKSLAWHMSEINKPRIIASTVN